MIAGIFHEGSGLGDQLFRYITVRTLAEEKGYKWGMYHPWFFKAEGMATFFMNFEFAHNASAYSWPVMNRFNEKDVRDSNGIDIRSYDPEINFVQDNTIIDGSFEDSKYWGHNLDNINKWLEVEPLEVPDDTCIVGFRGGEYSSNPDLFLTKEYYSEAIWKMYRLGVKNFQVHTDDPILAKQVFPSFEVIDNSPISHSKHTNMGFNWRSARFAKYAIIPNSAFYIIPRILRHRDNKSYFIDHETNLVPESDKFPVTIAPRYWARRNTKTWARPACYYKEFDYV